MPFGRTLIERNAICHWAGKRLPELETNRVRGRAADAGPKPRRT